ncbi:MAG: glycosyltransferase [Ignavibacteria bacterium]|jgi:GT2 family glycosyltransferase|nr:glycosyltransferase [Ignavibacteria bacterium]MCU7502552.1 glycosyltransferase [Ignavibacteria bacterium]MCU7515245.1 glycosyltransferase [Ignavibacteria bacterium]
MEDKIKVSFILPSFNREVILRQVLSRLSGHVYNFNYEIIVVDNNSSDNSVAMVKELFPRVRVLEMKSNLGAKSRNVALEVASGEYIMMLDDDSYPIDDSVEKAIAVLENDAEGKVGCIAFNIQRVDGSFETSGIYMNFTGCGAMFPKSIFELIGNYPEDYLYYAEEYDLSSRIMAGGFRILNFKELQVLHLKTPVNRNFNSIMCQLVRNNLLLWSKYLPAEYSALQIKTELWRYFHIARKEDALEGYERGKDLGMIEVGKYKADRSFEILPVKADILMDKENIRNIVSRIAINSQKGIIIFSVGKLLHVVLDEAEKAGVKVLGIIDDNKFMQSDTWDGITIYSRQRLLRKDYDAVLIGSSSLALNDRYEEELKEACCPIPVYRLCGYDNLNTYLRRD